MESGLAHKGLVNLAGSNNCFLNVVIQSLWHISPFRDAFLDSQSSHACRAKNACLACDLMAIFANYQYASEETLDPQEIRVDLSIVFSGQDRFRLGQMEDADEALEEILKLFHRESVGRKLVEEMKDDIACVPMCVPHKVFGISLCEWKTCQICHSQSEPVPSNLFCYRAWAQEIKEFSSCVNSRSSFVAILDTKEFACTKLDEALRVCYNSEIFPCPSNTGCPGNALIERYLLNSPPIFTLALAWISDPDRGSIESVLDIIYDNLNMNVLFGGNFHQRVEAKLLYRLSGFISYYGRHYVAFFKDSKCSSWFLLDDQSVRRLETWWHVKNVCLKGKFQPVIVFYEKM